MREATPNELSAALPIMSGGLSTNPLKISRPSEPPFDGPVTRSTPFAFTIASFLADRRRRPVRPCSFSAGQLFRPRTWLLNYAPENKLARLKCGRGDFFAGSNGETDMVNSQSRFVWYELMTTDKETAKAFYANVVGWGTRDAGLAYNLFTVGDAPVTGLMNRRDAALDRICRSPRRGCCRRPNQAAWRSGARPTDGRPQHQPLFGRRRPSNGNACVGQGAETRPSAVRRAGHTGARGLA